MKEQHIGNTTEHEIKELKSMKAFVYPGVEENHNIKYNNEWEKLKKNYIKKTKNNSEHRAKWKIKCKQMNHRQHQY
jgi:hypothetical protein